VYGIFTFTYHFTISVWGVEGRRFGLLKGLEKVGHEQPDWAGRVASFTTKFKSKVQTPKKECHVQGRLSRVLALVNFCYYTVRENST